MNHFLLILKRPFREFEGRVGQTVSLKGAKAELARVTVKHQRGDFRITGIERACPDVGRGWNCRILAEMEESGKMACQRKFPASRWRYRGESTTRGKLFVRV